MSKRATMQDVADALGVAKATVSRAFRSHPKCGPELRARILAKAKELGYAPDPFQSVHMGQVRDGTPEGRAGETIWMLDYQPENFLEKSVSCRRLVRGARERAAALGLGFEVFRPGDHGLNSTGLKRVMVARGIHGCIVGPMPVAQSWIDLELTQVAAVAFGHSLASPALHRISHDHYQAMWDTMAYLRERGHRRVGLALQRDILRRVGGRWHSGCIAFCEEHADMTIVPTIYLNRGVEEPGAENIEGAEVRAWARRHELDAVLGISPWIIPALAEEADTKNITFIDLDWYPGKSSHVCSGIDQHFELLGATAVDEVVAQWRRQEYGVPVEPKMILLHGRLVEPASASSGERISINTPTVGR